MDDATAKELLERLERLEIKVDAILSFTEFSQVLVRQWTTGSRGKIVSTLARMKSGDT